MITTQFNAVIKILRSDNGREYIDARLENYLSEHGIIHQTSCVYTPAQNGVAERKNRHLLDVARCLLLQMHLPKYYWGDAVLTAAYLINRLPSRVLGFQSPLATLGIRPTSLPSRVFGCVCFVHTQPKTKLDPRALKCVFIGYSPTQKGYKCFHPGTKRVFVTMDVTFRESEPYYGTSLQGESPSMEVSSPSSVPLPIPPTMVLPLSTTSPSVVPPPPGVSPPVLPPLLQVYTRRRRGTNTQAHVVPSAPSPEPLSGTSKGSSTSTQHPLCNFMTYDSLSAPHRVFVGSLDSISIPQSWQEALEHSKWKAAMIEEMEALEKNKTWELVHLPKGKTAVGCKWVFTVKQDTQGRVERYKARLVARGYTQTAGIDYQETFAPVAKMNSIRILLSCAVCKGWSLLQLDVKNAFLHGDLEEEVYMSLPPGVIQEGSTGKVCRLKKALYGLKQSPRAWFGRFHRAMISFGYRQSNADHTLFVKHREGKVAALIVYVDDIVITGDDIEEVEHLKVKLAKEFDVKDLGPLKYFLGIEVARSKHGIFISQRKYILDLLETTGMLGCRPADTPIEANHKLGRDEGEVVDDVPSFQRLVGKLIYLSHTRPDISYAVGVLSQYMHSPRSHHLDAAYRVLRYLKSTPGRGILFSPNEKLTIEVYTDADWAGSVDDRRSTSGYCSFVGGNLTTWRSKKQHVVARSSTEAEFRAMAQGICEGMWIQSVLKDLGIEGDGPIRIYCDNKAAISIAHNPVQHDRTKHVEIDRHFIKENIVKGIVSTPFVTSNQQLADVLTKGLSQNAFDRILGKLGMTDITRPT